jgi:hypothetical protein
MGLSSTFPPALFSTMGANSTPERTLRPIAAAALLAPAKSPFLAFWEDCLSIELASLICKAEGVVTQELKLIRAVVRISAEKIDRFIVRWVIVYFV